MIVGSMCNALCSSGGFCSGSFEITEHQVCVYINKYLLVKVINSFFFFSYLQRISGPAYCYSASLPAALTVSATESLNILNQNPQLPIAINFNTKLFKQSLVKIKYLLLNGSPDSPVIHLRINEEIVRVGDIRDKEKRLQEIVDEVSY